MGKSTKNSSEMKVEPKIVSENPDKGSRVSGKYILSKLDVTKKRYTNTFIGKWWKSEKKAFRIKSLGVKSSWQQKQEQRLKDQEFKEKLGALKEEKENKRKEHIEKIKERRKKKEEKERYEYLATKIHKKKLDRLKRREKRNKLLSER